MTVLHTSVERAALLAGIRTVAIVGMSDDPGRPSHEVASYLLAATGWEVWFVNPNHRTALGRTVYPTLAELPGVPDLVDVFRRADHLGEVAQETIEVGARALWFQLGLVDHAAAHRAAAAGLDVVQDRCLKVDHTRLAERRTRSGTVGP